MLASTSRFSDYNWCFVFWRPRFDSGHGGIINLLIPWSKFLAAFSYTFMDYLSTLSAYLLVNKELKTAETSVMNKFEILTQNLLAGSEEIHEITQLG
jgi:hypothetical protein